MDGNAETTIFRVKIPNHPVETTMLKWMFPVPGGTQFLAAPVIRIVHKQKLHHPCLAEYIFQLQAKQGFSVFLGLADSKARYFWLLNLRQILLVAESSCTWQAFRSIFSRKTASISPNQINNCIGENEAKAASSIMSSHRSWIKFGGIFCTKSFRNKTDSETWNFGFNWLKNGFQ